MNKNVMIALVVVVVGGLVWWMMGGDQYADAADATACAACEPAGVWTEAVGTEGEDGYTAGSCAAPEADADGDDADADADNG